MENNKYLNEEKYRKNKTLLIVISIIILLIGVSLGGFHVGTGIQRVTNNYKTVELAVEKVKLSQTQALLEAQGVKYDKTATYRDGKKYDLKVIIDALDHSFPHCNFDDSKKHELTKTYCKLKNANDETGIAFIMIGTFIIVATLMISGVIISKAYRRK